MFSVFLCSFVYRHCVFAIATIFPNRTDRYFVFSAAAICLFAYKRVSPFLEQFYLVPSSSLSPTPSSISSLNITANGISIVVIIIIIIIIVIITTTVNTCPWRQRGGLFQHLRVLSWKGTMKKWTTTMFTKYLQHHRHHNNNNIIVFVKLQNIPFRQGPPPPLRLGKGPKENIFSWCGPLIRTMQQSLHHTMCGWGGQRWKFAGWGGAGRKST